MLRGVCLMAGCALAALCALAQGTAAQPRRISFADARKILTGETEGNVTNQPGRFTRTNLRDGRVLELFYPIAPPAAARRSGRAGAPGYGLLYESAAAFGEGAGTAVRSSVRPGRASVCLESTRQ